MSEYGAVPFALMIVIIIYIMIGEYFKSIHFHLTHETSFGIIIGMIIFSGEYNLRKNFKYIVSFGLLSTLLNFIITLTLTIGFNSWKLVRLGTSLDFNISLSYDQMIKYSQTICATDSVAALNLIPSSQYPKLFSVVFLEKGWLMMLFQLLYFKQIYRQIFRKLHNFTIDRALCRTVFDLMFQKVQILTNSTATEKVFTFLMACMGYSICEMLDLSGVIVYQ